MSAITEPLKPPTGEELFQKALRHLARFSATEAGLKRVLERFVKRWAHKASVLGTPQATIDRHCLELKQEICHVVVRLCRVKALDDEAFARSKIRNLELSGHSRRLIEAHLRSKGIAPETVSNVMSNSQGTGLSSQADETERQLGAALIFARKRRLGPFAIRSQQEISELEKTRALARFARSGFTRSVAERVLSYEREAAETQLKAFKST